MLRSAALASSLIFVVRRCSRLVITHFIKPAEEQNLVRCAVIILLCSLFTLIAPFVVAGLLRFLFPKLPEVWCFVIPFTLWAAWLFSQCRSVIHLVRTTAFCDTSPTALHSIQAVAIITFVTHLSARGALNQQFLSWWIISVDFGLFAFFISYFLLAASSRMRLPWHSFLGFVAVCASLYFTLSSANSPK